MSFFFFYLQEQRQLHDPHNIIPAVMEARPVYTKPCDGHTHAYIHTNAPHCFSLLLPNRLNKSVMFAFYLLICKYSDVYDCYCFVQFYWET